VTALPIDPERYAAFLVVMTAVAAFPGPACLFATATGVARGWKAALAGVAGMNTATLAWYVAAALGLGALIAAFPEVFKALRLAGAAYLVWMAWGALKGEGAAPDAPAVAARPGAAFRDGFAVQVANPKLLLFFTAILPPFIDLARPAGGQLAVLGATMIAIDVVGMSIYGLGGAALAGWMRRPRFRRGFELVTAAMLALAAALVGLSAFEGS
jgi:threonine/homoserine/homoserine lactone efflux protein